jgi:hypothetical protein
MVIPTDYCVDAISDLLHLSVQDERGVVDIKRINRHHQKTMLTLIIRPTRIMAMYRNHSEFQSLHSHEAHLIARNRRTAAQRRPWASVEEFCARPRHE